MYNQLAVNERHSYSFHAAVAFASFCHRTFISFASHFVTLNLNIIAVSVCFFFFYTYHFNSFALILAGSVKSVWSVYMPRAFIAPLNWCWWWCICWGQLNTLHSINRWAFASTLPSPTNRHGVICQPKLAYFVCTLHFSSLENGLPVSGGQQSCIKHAIYASFVALIYLQSRNYAHTQLPRRTQAPPFFFFIDRNQLDKAYRSLSATKRWNFTSALKTTIATHEHQQWQ